MRKYSFTSMIITGIIVLGTSMLVFSVLFVLLLQILGRNGAFSSALFVKMELLIAAVYIFLMLVLMWGISHMVTKKIRKKGKVLIEVADNIRKQQLDFEVQLTGIVEIDTVLLSMVQMKEALAESLAAQWKMEQARRKEISALVHDLKTPITVLDGNLYLLRLEEVTDEGKKSVEDMAQCVREMDYYVTQLLEISREDLHGALKKETCVLNNLIDEVLQMMEVLFQQKNVRVERKNDYEQIEILCDKKEIKRAIQNVVSNALDFTPQDSVITIEVTKKDLYVVLSVSDSGSGFSEQDLENAKEQFYMGDASRGRKRHFGLGLSITNNIVNAHDGVLEIANRSDQTGGMVSIKLPIGEIELN